MTFLPHSTFGLDFFFQNSLVFFWGHRPSFYVKIYESLFKTMFLNAQKKTHVSELLSVSFLPLPSLSWISAHFWWLLKACPSFENPYLPDNSAFCYKSARMYRASDSRASVTRPSPGFRDPVSNRTPPAVLFHLFRAGDHTHCPVCSQAFAPNYSDRRRTKKGPYQLLWLQPPNSFLPHFTRMRNLQDTGNGSIVRFSKWPVWFSKLKITVFFLLYSFT